MQKNARKQSAFTLIELLIVVAIIAILAAIAVPNFLEAQVRAKVSRVHADLRTLAVGLESYKVDYNWYPINMYSYAHYWENGNAGVPDPWGLPPTSHKRGRTVAACCWRLTTPTAYITGTKEYKSPFWPTQHYFDWMITNTGQQSEMLDVGPTYLFGASQTATMILVTNEMVKMNPAWMTSGMMKPLHTWFVGTWGPKNPPATDNTGMWIYAGPPVDIYEADQPYDTTNGTVSRGMLVRTGP